MAPGGQTYGWQREERDAQEGEPSGQHASRPRLWCLVPVADGRQGDLSTQTNGYKLPKVPTCIRINLSVS